MTDHYRGSGNDAWAEVVAALPEGGQCYASVTVEVMLPNPVRGEAGWTVSARLALSPEEVGPRKDGKPRKRGAQYGWYATGPTLVAALRALAVELRERPA